MPVPRLDFDGFPLPIITGVAGSSWVVAVDRILQTELDLIGSIYDSVLDPGLWSDAIDRIRRYVGLHLGAIGISYLPSGISIQATTNIPPEFVRAIGATADTIPDLWGGVAAFSRLPVEEPIRMLDHSSVDQWPGNPFYEAFCRPQGLVDQLCLILEYQPNLVATFALGLHESMPPIDDRQVEIFRALAPHMRRAVLIGNLLEARSIVATTFEAALDALGSAILLVDANGQIVYANGRADQMLHAGDPIASLNGRIEVPRELVKGQLERAVAAAKQPDEALGPGGGIAVRRRDGSGAIVHVLPLQRRTTRPVPNAVAAVFVAEPNTALNLPLEGLRLLYDLRPAETRVLDLIASGLSGRAVAEALGISENTVHTHTTRLFEKLGVHSRAEAVALVRDMSLDA